MIENNIKNLDINATHCIFISDIHFGKHVNSEEWQDNMRNYFYNFFIPHIKTIKNSLSATEKLICIILRDTYDDRKAIDINVNNLSIDVIEDIAREVELYVLNGNHDLSKKTNKGNSSLRSIEYIPNVYLITDPTILNINYEAAKHMKMIAIPYLGNIALETEYLVKYSAKVKYALMHTEITSMKMDNGITITNGANPDMFKGKILSGHIHKRQENKNCIYVGSPYQLDKSDMGNEKGLYLLNIKENKLDFKKNDYSPIFHTIYIEDYDTMTIDERRAFFNNNYNYVIINEEDRAKYQKKYDIYNLGIGTTAKSTLTILNKQKQEIDVEEGKEYKEMTIAELINESIEQLDVSDENKMQLTKLSNEYLKEAESELSFD